jgi:hypothetical protein
MMFPQLGVTELVCTLTQHMNKLETDDLKTTLHTACRTLQHPPYTTANCWDLHVRELRSVGSKLYEI